VSSTDLKEQWLTQRKGGIGGTDISAILGLNPWRNAIDVYLAKLGLAQQPETQAMRLGNRLEPVIADEYADLTGSTLVRGAEIAQLFPGVANVWRGHTVIEHREHRFLIGTPDAIVLDAERGLEIKNAGFQGREWGRPGTDEIPHHYLLQCAWYMALTGLSHWDVAVLFSGNRMEIYTVRRNTELESALLKVGVDFWQRHVLTQTPPPVDSSKSYAQYLAKKFHDGTEQVVTATPEVEHWAARLRDVQAQIERHQQEEQLARNHLMNLVGHNKGMKGAFGKATWVRPRHQAATDWEALARSFNPTPEQIERFTTEKSRSAYLKVTFAEKEESNEHAA
jgi:predicted phage-related endonuclease